MITACVACGLIAAGCIACVWCTLGGRKQAAYLRRVARYHLLRRRYARRMHGPLPGHDQDVPYDHWGWLAALDAWEAPAARTEETRT
jgi:hypothetical protein